MADSLKEKTLSSFAIIFFYKASWLVITFIRSIIIARLLFPEDFAIVALAISFIGLIEQLFTFGFRTIIIHKQNITTKEISTAYALTVLQNSVFFLIAFFCAPYVAAFYDKPVLELVIRVSSTVLIMRCIGFIPEIMLNKNMRFKETETIYFAANVLGALITVVLAYLGWAHWSIIAGTLLSELCRSVAFLYLSSLRVKISFDRKIVKQFIRTGSILYASAILSYLTGFFPTIILGKVAGLAILGYYTVSSQWAMYFHKLLYVEFTKVLFPGYSAIQDDRERLKHAVTEGFRIALPLILPCYVGFVLVAPDFIKALLGERWVPATVPMQILLFYALINSAAGIAGPVSDAIGRFDIRLKMSIINLIALMILFPLLGHFGGMVGYCSAKLCVAAASFIIHYWLVCKRELRLGWRALWFATRSSVVGICIMALAVYGAGKFLSDVTEKLQLMLVVIAGASTYLLVMAVIDRELVRKYRTIGLGAIAAWRIRLAKKSLDGSSG